MDPKPDRQLRLIQEVTELLRAADVPHWLFGGWAVDFLAGRVTRAHRDIEFVIWTRDQVAVAQLLAEHGFQAGQQSIEMSIYFNYEQLLEFYSIEPDSSGHIITPGKWANWPWMEGSFDTPPAQLAGITCPVTSVHNLLATKQDYAHFVPRSPLRDKDMADIEVLRGLLAR
jgi:hypothetical protein